ncbi:MAG: CSS-motif domain-containing protein, partial [Oricola sp.]
MGIYRLSLRAIPHKRSVLVGGFLLGFAVAATLLAVSGLLIAKSRLAYHAADHAQSLSSMTSKWLSTFDRLAALDERDACSPHFITQLRQIAFLPDGIHELLYAQGDSILCSVTVGKAEQPIPLGLPDLTLNDRGIDVWIDRDLHVLGLPGLPGTFLRLGNFMMIISEPELVTPPAVWMEQRLYYLTADRNAAAGGWGSSQSVCEANGIYCIDLSAPVEEIVAHERMWITVGVVLSALCGLIAMWPLSVWLDRLWAFPNRFRKLMDQGSVICDYQPILSFAENRIGGIEVLARWRDITGEKIYPDKFLPVVQSSGLTRSFTEILVRRVYG